jgi:hypothetical protein
MSKSTPQAPPPPDPVATAQAQSQTNKDAAVAQANLNRIDQYTPQGSLTYAQTGTNADGTPKYSQTMTLSSDEQAKYDSGNKIALALNGLAGDNITRVSDAQSKPFTYDGMTPIRTDIGGNNPFQLSNGPKVGSLIYGVPQQDSQGVQGAGQGVQHDLDYSKLTALPGVNDFGAEQQRMADSVYAKAASRLNPQWEQTENDVRSRLAAQGISENSDAYRREYDNMMRAKNDAYDQATYSAQQAGSQEQSRLFGLALNARQEGKSEVDSAGTFHNTAQGQGFTQAATAADQALRANDQNFQQRQANAGLNNQTENQAFTEGTSAAQLNNQNQNQYFNQDSAAATFNNQARQQQIEQAAYLRNLPLNDIAALLGTGPGVAQPDFNPVAQVGVAAPDYMGLVSSNYGQAVSQYNTQQQARSQMLGSIFGALGSVGGAVAMSDRRFKENIRRIGTLASGIPTYAFNYVFDKAQEFGVMAQDLLAIRPEAVIHGPDGVMYVDYGKVY